MVVDLPSWLKDSIVLQFKVVGSKALLCDPDHRKGAKLYPMLWQAGRKFLGVTTSCLASEICEAHEIYIRDHDSGKMHKNAKRM